MLKKTVTYTDFDGNKITEDLYFNISKVELMEMEVSMEEGFAVFLTKVYEAGNKKEMVSQIKKFIVDAYGVKSEDGKRFMKSPEITENFKYSAAFDQVFIDLTQNEQGMVEFMYGAIPADFVKKVQEQPQDKPRGLPPTPPKPPVL